MRLKNLEAVLILCMALILWLFSGCVPAPTESPASCAPLAKMSAEATLPEGHYLSDPLTVPLETTGQMRMVVKDSTIFLETVTLRGTPARPVTGMTDPRSEERRVGKECRTRWATRAQTQARPE